MSDDALEDARWILAHPESHIAPQRWRDLVQKLVDEIERLTREAT